MDKIIPLARLGERWLLARSLFIMLLGLFFLMPSNVSAQMPTHESMFTPTSNNVFPLGSTTSNRVQWLYLPTEIMPPPTPGLITKIYLRVGSNYSATTYTNLTVKLGTTLQTATTATFVSGMQVCYFAASTSFPAHSQGDWLEITLQTPFLWNATESLIVEVSQEGYTASRGMWQYSSNGNRRTWGSAIPQNPTGSAGGGQVHLGLDMMPATPCSGQVVAGTASASVTDACGNVPFNLSLSGNTNATGVTYQWQSSPAGAGTFTDMQGATSAFYIVNNQTAATDYRCVVVCTNSNTTDTSTIVSVGQNPFTECYCIPPYSTGCSSYNLNSFIITGEGTSEISDLNTGCNNTDGTGYSKRMSMFNPVDLLQDASYPVQINTTSTIPASTRASIWIDFNNDGFFDDATERLMDEMPLATSPLFASALIDIPYDAPPGVHRMRVRVVYSTTGYDACSSATWGETHDYDVNVIAVNCYRPLEFEVDNIKKNSVDIVVTDNPNNTGAVNYYYEVRESGDPGSGPAGLVAFGAATTNPFTITGLQPLTEYKVYIRTICSPTDNSSWTKEEEFTTMCNYPDLIAAPGKTVCGPQEVDLTAIFDGGTVYWLDEDGDVVHTGANFTTPYLTDDTTYWVVAGDSLTFSGNVIGGGGGGPSVTGGGRVAPNSGSTGYAATTLHYGIQFDATAAFTISSVDVYPASTSQGTMTVVLADNSGVVLQTAGPFALPAGTGTSIPSATPVTIPLNIDVPSAGTGYRLYTTNLSTALIRESSGLTFPYPIGTLGNVTSGWANGGFSASTYYYFYNWQIGGGAGIDGCASELVEVPVIVEPKPDFELSSYKVTSCEGGVTDTVTITTNLGGYDTFVWTPSTGVSGDAVNGWTFTTPTEQEYILSASQSGGICEHIKTVLVFSGVEPEADPNLATVQDVCKDAITELQVLEEMPSNVTFGALTTSTSANSGVSAFVQSEEYSKQQYIYSASELIALGADTAGFITGLDLNTINSGASFDNANYTIKMLAYNNTSFPTDDFVNGNFTTVYTREVHTHSFQGWQQFVFDNPFYWDGQSNIIVQITQEGIGDGLNLNNAQTYYTDVTGTNVGLHATSATNANPATGTRTTNRLDARFSFEQSTVSWSPFTNLFVDSSATIPYTGQNALKVYHTSSTSGSQVYTATLTAPSGCVATESYTLNVITVGTPVVASQSFCGSTPVSSIVVTGHQGALLNFYNSATSTSPITTISQSGTYYVEAKQGDCVSSRVAFTVSIVTLANPTVSQLTQVICGSGTVADLNATATGGAQIQWYSSATSTTPLASTHALVNNTTYYAAQAVNGCISGRVAVLVNINSAPAALTAQTINICGDLTYDGANLNQLGGAELVWYQSATSQQPIPGTGQIVSGTYYVSQKVNGCESPRAQIIVTAQPGTVPAPTATTQNICGSGTVADLVAQTAPGGVAVWYNSSTSTTPLQPNAILSSGTYYLAQQIGNCLSTKVPVAVRIVNTSIPTVSPITLCAGATVADLDLPAPTGAIHKWYINSTSTTPLDPTTVLTSGYYFVIREQSGCESARVQVQVTINSRPNSPTGAIQQNFVDYAEIDNLVMDQPNVVWYLTYEDAMNGINPLPANMPLVDETTYYAVIIGSNGCPSLPTAVEVIITVGVNDFDLTQLKYYPNPTSDLLTISYNEPIVKVEVFDLNGRMIMNRDFDKETVELDFSRLSSGTYMLNIKTKDSSQFVKIVRK